ncbi:MAG: ABC transporter ATP-binding protein [Caldilineaceae bacterium]|nr:ABC transporter ATP-binding protein [Caldilineaceae bacterium]
MSLWKQTTPLPTVPPTNKGGPLLAVEDLRVQFRTRMGVVKALDQVSFTVNKGEIVGIVGESGSGKSVLSYTIMGILEANGQVTGGRVRLDGTALPLRSTNTRARRSGTLAMIFQNPRAALNPIRPVGKQIMDVLRQNPTVQPAAILARARELLQQVHIPLDRFTAYPFELSGGMCQRVLIALALATSPSLLVADEPTTGLDVVTQQAIMELVVTLAQEQQMSTLLITHDMALAARYCQRIMVMHAGHVVEIGTKARLFQHPRHPYTAKLIAATPGISTTLTDLVAIPGQLPDLRSDLPPCRYLHRCERAVAACHTEPLPNPATTAEHGVACWNPL